MKIDLHGNWRIYQSYCPSTWEMLGTVVSDKGDVGALAKIKYTGMHVMVNAGVIKNLQNFEVKRLIKLATEDANAQ